jgi:hypothetical protein
MGCIPGDLNEDGLLDVLVYYWGRTPIAFLRTLAPEDADETGSLTAACFQEREVLPNGERWYTNAATRADIDGDGHVDLVVGNYFPDNASILNEKGTGRETMQHSMTRAYNGGRNRILLWDGASGQPVPDVAFREVEVQDEDVARGWTLAMGAADLDGDLLPEIYFAHNFGPDRLLHNRSRPGSPSFAVLKGSKSLTTPNSKVLGGDSFKGMGIDFGDLNGDGWLDIYVSNIAAEYALEESHFAFLSTGKPELMWEGRAPYVDKSEALGLSRSGWGWETRLADFDNDGILEAIQATGFVKGKANRWPELQELAIGNDELLSNPNVWPRFRPGDDLSGHQHNPFFVRASSGRFVDLAPELGLDNPQVTRGIAVADVDGDGDLDFAVGNQWERSQFYRNENPDPKPFLGLHLLLPVEDDLRSHDRNEGQEGARRHRTLIRSGHPGPGLRGRPAIGASVELFLPDDRSLVAQVDGGNGHSGVRSPDIHFGLGSRGSGSGTSTTELKAKVRWRDCRGQLRGELLYLTPGWHTVLLGDTSEEIES